ncbi:MAG: lysophospholipid acyltransferase family protein [Verrucomicrobiota bacterium]
MSETPPAKPARRSGVVVPQSVKWHGRLAAALIYIFTRLLYATIRFRWDDRSGLFDQDLSQRVIFAGWHNRLALSFMLYIKYVQSRAPSRQMVALISASRDGGLLARTLEHFGVSTVRGSSSRRGAQALLELTTCAERGYDLAITPDGPRGPCYQVQDGVIAAAQLTGLPIVPVSYHLNWKYRLKNWDRFQVPLPFACCTVTLGEAISVPREASDEERARLKEKLQSVMMEITKD